jgi:hypothetical protein
MGALEWFIVVGIGLALLCGVLAWAAGRSTSRTYALDEHYLDGEAAELERRGSVGEIDRKPLKLGDGGDYWGDVREAAAEQAKAERRRQRAESLVCTCPECISRARHNGRPGG